MAVTVRRRANRVHEVKRDRSGDDPLPLLRTFGGVGGGRRGNRAGQPARGNRRLGSPSRATGEVGNSSTWGGQPGNRGRRTRVGEGTGQPGIQPAQRNRPPELRSDGRCHWSSGRLTPEDRSVVDHPPSRSRPGRRANFGRQRSPGRFAFPPPPSGAKPRHIHPPGAGPRHDCGFSSPWARDAVSTGRAPAGGVSLGAGYRRDCGFSNPWARDTVTARALSLLSGWRR